MSLVCGNCLRCLQCKRREPTDDMKQFCDECRKDIAAGDRYFRLTQPNAR